MPRNGERRTSAVFLAIAFGLSCMHPRAASSALDTALAGPPRLFLDGSEARVDLLARQLLTRGSHEPTGYAYYCYLLFADSSTERERARRAAASAYLRLLRDVTEVGRVAKPENMAVLFAPIRDRASASAILRDREVAVFLRSYDYDTAHLLVSALRKDGETIPDVAIVGSRLPLRRGAGDAGTRPAVSVVNLEAADEGGAERIVLRLRDDLEAGKVEVSQRGEIAVLRRLREFFALVGRVGADLDAAVAKSS